VSRTKGNHNIKERIERKIEFFEETLKNKIYYLFICLFSKGFQTYLNTKVDQIMKFRGLQSDRIPRVYHRYFPSTSVSLVIIHPVVVFVEETGTITRIVTGTIFSLHGSHFQSRSSRNSVIESSFVVFHDRSGLVTRKSLVRVSDIVGWFGNDWNCRGGLLIIIVIILLVIVGSSRRRSILLGCR
jgi:hypothetical protein